MHHLCCRCWTSKTDVCVTNAQPISLAGLRSGSFFFPCRYKWLVQPVLYITYAAALGHVTHMCAYQMHVPLALWVLELAQGFQRKLQKQNSTAGLLHYICCRRWTCNTHVCITNARAIGLGFELAQTLQPMCKQLVRPLVFITYAAALGKLTYMCA